MSTIEIQEIERDLKAFLRRIEAGESLIVVRDDQPVAEIKPVIASAREPRPYGLCAGQFTVPADFNDPLPEEILREFEGR
ncbi:MAG: type II toxin-antitoxin system Phd/YefM family antitoxin [bacterium]